jgi:glycerol-3-phosphate acyltransferase PlsY
MTLLPDIMGWDQAWPWLLGALLTGYLIGSVPYGVIIARLFSLGDLRQVGSGNIGATNVLRTGNKSAAALTLFFDMGKGWVAVFLLTSEWGDVPGELAGFGAFLGHCFPIWLKFRGGKGVATFLGLILGFSFVAGLACCATWLVVAFIGKRSSLAALVAAASAAVWLWVLGDVSPIWITIPTTALLWVRHHENIARLFRGQEPKIGAK